MANSAIALQHLRLELLGHETSRRKQMRAGPLEVAQWNVCLTDGGNYIGPWKTLGVTGKNVD